MRKYIADNWPDMVDSALQGLRDGVLACLLIIVLYVGAELLDNARATFAIVRDLRGEFRSAVGPKESTEE